MNKYKEQTRAFLLQDKQRTTNPKDRLNFRVGLNRQGVGVIPKRKYSKRVGKAIYKFGIVTLPFPTASPVFIIVGKLMSLYDIADIKRISIVTMRKGRRSIRMIKIKMGVY